MRESGSTKRGGFGHPLLVVVDFHAMVMGWAAGDEKAQPRRRYRWEEEVAQQLWEPDLNYILLRVQAEMVKTILLSKAAARALAVIAIER